MGYTTSFDGQLSFTTELKASELSYLGQFMGADIRGHPEWINNLTEYGSYIQFELAKDFSGIKWDGSEKFYNADGCVNLIIENMQAKYPDFGLEGELLAQGGDAGDRWYLRIVDGKAVRIEHPFLGQEVECPHCECKFKLEA